MWPKNGTLDDGPGIKSIVRTKLDRSQNQNQATRATVKNNATLTASMATTVVKGSQRLEDFHYL